MALCDKIVKALQTDLTRDKLAGLMDKETFIVATKWGIYKGIYTGKYGSQIVINLLYSYDLYLISVI